MSAPNKRQIIILAALTIPVIGLIVLSSMGAQKPRPALPATAPKVEGNQGNATPKTPATPGDKAVTPTLEEMRANIAARWKEATSMTQSQYAARLLNDPRLPPTLDLYRWRLHGRMQQLEKMTPEDFEAEQRLRADHLRQRGRVPEPSAPAATVPAAQPAATQPPATPQSAVTR